MLLCSIMLTVRSCVAQAISRGDGSRLSLHAAVQYREYNEGFIFVVRLIFDANELNKICLELEILDQGMVENHRCRM